MFAWSQSIYVHAHRGICSHCRTPSPHSFEANVGSVIRLALLFNVRVVNIDFGLIQFFSPFAFFGFFYLIIFHRQKIVCFPEQKYQVLLLKLNWFSWRDTHTYSDTKSHEKVIKRFIKSLVCVNIYNTAIIIFICGWITHDFHTVHQSLINRIKSKRFVSIIVVVLCASSTHYIPLILGDTHASVRACMGVCVCLYFANQIWYSYQT